MKKTLYVTDLDGTLMRDDKTISDTSTEIFNSLIEDGVPITYATARSIRSASVITGGIHFALPVITRNGTVFADSGTVCYFTFIADKEELDPLFLRVGKGEQWNCVYQRDTYRPEYWLELCPRAATKANAIRKLQEKCGCERLVVFGDTMNDASMFRIADEAYAVGNADDGLKEIATGVLGTNQSDSVAGWLRQYAQSK